MKLLLSIFIPTVLLSIGCDSLKFPGEDIFQGTSTGNAMEIGLDSVEQTPISNDLFGDDSDNTQFEITTAFAHVEKFEFDFPSFIACQSLGLSSPLGCASEDRIRVEGPFVVDLVNATTDPPLDNMTLPGISFERIDSQFSVLDHSNVSEEEASLIDHTIVAHGNFNYDGSDYTFSVKFAFDSQIVFESSNEIKLQDNSTLKMLFNVRYWFADAAITSCIDSGELEIVDDHLEITNACPGALDSIENAIKDSSYLDVE